MNFSIFGKVKITGSLYFFHNKILAEEQSFGSFSEMNEVFLGQSAEGSLHFFGLPRILEPFFGIAGYVLIDSAYSLPHKPVLGTLVFYLRGDI